MDAIRANDAPTSPVYYLPFWVLLPDDPVPMDAFARCHIQRRWTEPRIDQRGAVVHRECCDIQVFKGDRSYNVSGVEADQLIEEKDLPAWKRKIADWFLNYNVFPED